MSRHFKAVGERVRAVQESRRSFGWSLLDQTLASATTFLLTLEAAREFGPAGVGTIAVPYAACLVLLGLQRAVLVDPYMTRDVSETVSDKRALSATRSLSLCGGILGTLVFAGVGLIVTDPIGTGFLAFAPWVIPTLIQGLLRSASFRDGKGKIAAFGSGLMLITFVLTASTGLHGSVSALIVAWGIGSLVAAAWLLIAVQGSGLARPLAAARWWISESMHFGGWLATGAITWSIFSYGLIAGLATVTGTAAVGGYRAIESIFSPLSLLAPALANPGFKTMRDAWGEHPSEALRFAFRLSAVATGCMAAYALVVGAGREIVFYLYGDDFRTYSTLIIPIALGQIFIAATIGFVTLLKVARRGRDTVTVGAGGAFVALVVGLPLGALLGITAAAWGIALSFAPPLVWAARMATAAARDASTVAADAHPANPPPPVQV